MRHESGDTLVEVLIATAILGAAVVAGLGIMNFGFGVILNSIERTQVQASVNSQLSFIQYARDAYVRAGRQGTELGGPKTWSDLVANTTSTYSANVCNVSGAPDTDATKKPFYIEIKEDASAPPQKITEYVPMTDFPVPAATAVPTAGNGVWVEAVRPATNPNYIDFYVKACWSPAAGSTHQESRSVMRLYTAEPVLAVTGLPVLPASCTNLASVNHIINGNFTIPAGNGPNVAAAAGFTSQLPNRGDGYYPDDAGLNGTTKVYTGGLSLQNGPVVYGTPLYPNALRGQPFPGDVPRGVPPSSTYFYSNPNQRVDQPPGTVTTFSGVLWQQNISGLIPNSTYDFSGYFDNLMIQQSQGVNPRIQLRANGVPLMTPVEIFVLPDAWQRVTLLFTTGPTQTSVSLEIFDYANSINGDDFGMTALALRRCV